MEDDDGGMNWWQTKGQEQEYEADRSGLCEGEA